MSYQHDAGRLARALAELLTADPLPPAALPAHQAQPALVCRDTLVGAVRDLTGAVLRRTPPSLHADPELRSRSPVHALHAALRELPPATGRDLTLTDALAVQACPAVARWQRAARAAVTLETYLDAAAALPGPAAWSLARDLGALSGALPALDVDLAATLTASISATTSPARTAAPSILAAAPDGAVAALLDGPSHGLLQFTASELAAQTADVPPAVATLPGRSREPIGPVHHLSDLPAASGQLADLLHRRAGHLTVTEARAALRIVAYGIDLTTRTLTAGQQPRQHAQKLPGDTGPVPDPRPGLDDAVRQWRQALPQLQAVLHNELATLTPPDPRVLHLSQQIQTRLTAAGRLHEALQTAGPAGPPDALTEALTRWAVTAAPLMAAVRGGLHAATSNKALLAPRRDTAAGRRSRLFWLPLQHSDPDPHPALQATDRAAAALRRAATSLTGPPDPTAADRPASARRAAADAAAAFGELTIALQSRPAKAWPNPTRTAHPAVPRAHTGQRPRR